MVDQGALFEQDETLTVGQVTTRLNRAVAGAFPAEVWVRGEVDGLRPPTANGHVYLTLCEKARGRDSATIGAAVLRGSRLRIDRALAEHPGFRLADGIEVRVRGRVQYAYGRIQLLVSEIDPVHTLGRLAAERDRVLHALRAEGLLERNGRLPLPAAPLRVALVTSDGSAACHDALHELEASGIGFRVVVADARVQGHGAEVSLLAAMAHAVAARPDAVLLVRGGGSRTDLATFDGERLARAIAAAPVPVLTGVGHEIDTSVADAVAHTAYKTPTACAAAVVDQVRRAAGRGEAAWAGIARVATVAGSDAGRSLEARAEALAGRAGGAVRHAEARLDARGARLSHRADLGLWAADGQLRETARRLDRGAGAVLDAARDRVRRADRLVDAPRLHRALDRRDADLASAVARLRRSAAAASAGRTATLDVLAARADAVDPARALARGWSITRTADGALARRAADLAPGARLRTTLADGTVTSTVEKEETS
jgi:exodeoxyribonuclease VII large subunit